MGWNRDTGEEYVSEIFNALKIPLPPVVFITSKSNPPDEHITKDRAAMLFPKLGLRRKPSRTESTATIPNRQDSSAEGSDHDVLQLFDLIKEDPTEEEIKLFHTISESKLLSIMKAISNTFAQCNAIYLSKHNTKYLEFDEMVGKSLPENGVQLVPVVLNKDQVTIFRQNSVPISDEVMHGIPGFRDDYSTGATSYASRTKKMAPISTGSWSEFCPLACSAWLETHSWSPGSPPSSCPKVCRCSYSSTQSPRLI